MKNLLKILTLTIIAFCFSVFAAASPPGNSKAKTFDLQATCAFMQAFNHPGSIFVQPGETFTAGDFQSFAAQSINAERNHAVIAAAGNNPQTREEISFGLAYKHKFFAPDDAQIFYDLPPNDAFQGFGVENNARAKI